MAFDRATRHSMLRERATAYLRVAVDNIEREYPHMPWAVVTGPGSLPSHRELHPAFFGAFDWHSCVEMYWVAVRLLRLYPDAVDDRQARAVMSSLLTPDNIATETAFFTDPGHAGFERPYGWGWLLTLMNEVDCWSGDPDAARWAPSLRPLADELATRFVAWLPRLTYPQRVGMHANTAFGLLRSLDYAERRAATGDSRLRDAIHEAGHRFYLNDRAYPARYEPSGADFLSPALAEAELMSRLLDPESFTPWLAEFLPGLAEDELFVPAVVSDETDGQIAHLAGLNLSRAASMVAIAGRLPDDDPRVPRLLETAEEHAARSLPSVVGGHYMVEHWLAAYATLLLS